jgi:hypothetical protein
MKADHLGQLDLTPQPEREPRLPVRDILWIVAVLIPGLPVALWLLRQALALSIVGEA